MPQSGVIIDARDFCNATLKGITTTHKISRIATLDFCNATLKGITATHKISRIVNTRLIHLARVLLFLMFHIIFTVILRRRGERPTEFRGGSEEAVKGQVCGRQSKERELVQ